MPGKKPKPKAKGKLSDLEERFVGEYLSDLNGTAAYLRLKPSLPRDSAKANAGRMLSNVNVKAEIARRLDELRRQSGADAERLIRELSNQAFGDPAEVIDMTSRVPKLRKNLSPSARKLIAGLEFKAVTVIRRGKPATEYVPKVRFVDSLAAKDKLMRHLSLYKDLPPLEIILAAIPGQYREAIRGHLAAALLAGSDSGGVGGADSGDTGRPYCDTCTDSARPDDRDAIGWADPGPVAGTHDPAEEPTDSGTLYPAIGEDTDSGSEDSGPLFDS